MARCSETMGARAQSTMGGVTRGTLLLLRARPSPWRPGRECWTSACPGGCCAIFIALGSGGDAETAMARSGQLGGLFKIGASCRPDWRATRVPARRACGCRCAAERPVGVLRPFPGRAQVVPGAGSADGRAAAPFRRPRRRLGPATAEWGTRLRAASPPRLSVVRLWTRIRSSRALYATHTPVCPSHVHPHPPRAWLGDLPHENALAGVPESCASHPTCRADTPSAWRRSSRLWLPAVGVVLRRQSRLYAAGGPVRDA